MRERGEKHIPVDASDQNDKESSGNGIAKLFKVAIMPEPPAIRALRLGTSQPPPHPDIVVHAEGAKDDEHDDLQRDAGNDGLVAALLQLAVGLAARGRDAAADGLDDEAAEVGGQEDDGVPAGLDAGGGGVDVDGDVLEGEVDGDADEGGREDDGADLELKGAVVPGVGVQLDTADVAYEGVSIYIQRSCMRCRREMEMRWR
jgi:hypothetical protein